MAAISCTLLIDDTLPWAVLMGDEQHIIRRFNQQVARWCGHPPKPYSTNPWPKPTCCLL